MTVKQKAKLDLLMRQNWNGFLLGKLLEEDHTKYYEKVNYIIQRGSFQRFYVSCEKNRTSYWVFVKCDGICGYFDGYAYYFEYPVSLVDLWGIRNQMNDFVFEGDRWTL